MALGGRPLEFLRVFVLQGRQTSSLRKNTRRGVARRLLFVETRPFRSQEALATIKHVGGLRPNRVFTWAAFAPVVFLRRERLAHVKTRPGRRPPTCFIVASASGERKGRVFTEVLTPMCSRACFLVGGLPPRTCFYVGGLLRPGGSRSCFYVWATAIRPNRGQHRIDFIFASAAAAMRLNCGRPHVKTRVGAVRGRKRRHVKTRTGRTFPSQALPTRIFTIGPAGPQPEPRSF